MARRPKHADAAEKFAAVNPQVMTTVQVAINCFEVHFRQRDYVLLIEEDGVIIDCFDSLDSTTCSHIQTWNVADLGAALGGIASGTL